MAFRDSADGLIKKTTFADFKAELPGGDVVLVDTVTSTNYVLTVADGQLGIEEVAP